MKKPKTIKGCPVCEYDGKLKLKLDNFSIRDDRAKIIETKWWKYLCPKCEESFTTTESDELSLEILDKHKSRN